MSFIIFPFTFIGITAFGWITFIISLLIVFKTINIRIIFIPPAVEPAHEPKKYKISRVNFDADGQRSKSAFAKPDVEAIDVT